MSNSKKKKMPKGSMETFFKVLRMIGRLPFSSDLKYPVLAAVTVVHAALCTDPFRKCH